jgi:radical SAM superfamily enzyme with C-terminal helix-hairpin-helix motif
LYDGGAVSTNRPSPEAITPKTVSRNPITKLTMSFCRFCNEPGKAPTVAHRTVEDVLAEATQLYDAGVRHFRLGQQTCFFSYQGRSEEAIRALLTGIPEECPELEMLADRGRRWWATDLSPSLSRRTSRVWTRETR